ncbi:putative Membrane-associated tyrosine- and threonine-specific cdc2-inhibitory kinase [Blattamonas nauphoetae]|uniref:Membrane-associated tyrosine- and threonine-specific cdc2-inhibitory kinase n=1 Tax=Blattamonas nauphoetae TaxID=2049346 RepID=A0ABQ9X7V8_9EUKA|nr:putative Membrane-associated tyrosine- and threonine-specific cdc2-inhibitory kinase [Blattamonas nauphoetae]
METSDVIIDIWKQLWFVHLQTEQPTIPSTIPPTPSPSRIPSRTHPLLVVFQILLPIKRVHIEQFDLTDKLKQRESLSQTPKSGPLPTTRSTSRTETPTPHTRIPPSDTHPSRPTSNHSNRSLLSPSNHFEVELSDTVLFENKNIVEVLLSPEFPFFHSFVIFSLSIQTEFPFNSSTPVAMLIRTDGSYSVVRKLGQGRFGAVYEVSKAGSDEHFAVKVLPFTSEADFNKNEYEIAKLQKYQHSNVVGLVEVIEGDNAHFVVLELCSCSLADRVSEVRKLGTMMDRVTVFRIVSDVLAGLGFLHSRNEVYGDVKPSNILIGFDGRAKLGDFGGVVGVGTQKTSNSAECGTMQFWGPEMFVVGGNGVLGSQAGDMWAFGLIVLELLTGESWICGTNAVEIASSVGGFDVVCVCRQASMSSSVESLLCFLLSKNPQERLSSAELIRSGRLRSILGEETPLSQFIREELDSTKRTVDQLRTEKDQMQAQLKERDNTIDRLEQENKEKDETIAELTQKLGESVAMEKRQDDKLSTTHLKVVAVEAQKTEAATNVKRIGGNSAIEVESIAVIVRNIFSTQGKQVELAILLRSNLHIPPKLYKYLVLTHHLKPTPIVILSNNSDPTTTLDISMF